MCSRWVCSGRSRIYGSWIAPVEGGVAPAGRRPAMLLRGEFALGDEAIVRAARLDATAHGIYEAFVNGRRVGDAELTPGYVDSQTNSRGADL